MELNSLPEDYFDDEDPTVVVGFQCISRLFSHLDRSFVQLWNSPSVAGQAQRMAGVSGELIRVQHEVQSLSFETSGLSDIQKADVLITQQWLRLVFWQAAMRQGFVSSVSRERSLSYEYPIDIAKDLCVELSRLPVHAVIVHGLGIFEKVFEVAFALMDTLQLCRVRPSDSDELKFLFECLSASPNSHDTYVKILVTKLDGRKSLHTTSGTGVLHGSDAQWSNAA